jgi:aminopeptidase N
MLKELNHIQLFTTFLVGLFFIQSCKNKKIITKGATLEKTYSEIKEIKVVPSSITALYRATPEISFDILHTDLEVKFDLKNHLLLGEATHLITSYKSKKIDSIILDAKSMKIESVNINNKAVSFSIDKKYLRIAVNGDILLSDTFKLAIKYIAQPDLKEAGGSASIKNDKGLYFINTDKYDSLKPTQIWTQGETEANSCWFPTVDKPGNKSTFTIKIHVPENMTSLSNGILVKKEGNMHTWSQMQPMSAYLVMMAIGRYDVIPDKWRKIEVPYYVEPAYKSNAKQIFSETPEMIEFFSKRLGVDFPWDKYAQVVARDYVSGAMENTSASLFGEFVQKTNQELIDGDNQGIVAHELFHQWFGDLVTCESWSNLFLNEGFATYGEYLWYEHSKSKEFAEHHSFNEMRRYLGYAENDDKPIVRFNYADKEDMFNTITYKKGGKVLHLLRYTLGDEVFFNGIKKYLNTYKFKTAEVHDLRKIMEEESGKDLNLFFNEWIFTGGHANIQTDYTWINKDSIKIELKQILDSTKKLYHTPIAFKIINQNKEVYQPIFLSKEQQSVTINISKLGLQDTTQMPAIIADADHILIGKINENVTSSALTNAYFNTTSFYDKARIIYQLIGKAAQEIATNKVLFNALQSDMPLLRNLALVSVLNNKLSLETDRLQSIAEQMSLSDNLPKNRADALKVLMQLKVPQASYYIKAISDSSFAVKNQALIGWSGLDSIKAYEWCLLNKDLNNGTLVTTIAKIVGNAGNIKDSSLFINWTPKWFGTERSSLIDAWCKHLQNCKNAEYTTSTLRTFAYYANTDERKRVKQGVIRNMDKILKYSPDLFSATQNEELSILKLNILKNLDSSYDGFFKELKWK